MKEEFVGEPASGRLVWNREVELSRDELRRLASIVHSGWEGNRPTRVEVSYTSQTDAQRQASAVEFAGAVAVFEGHVVKGGVPITVRDDFGLK
jgi:hypothetical protein